MRMLLVLLLLSQVAMAAPKQVQCRKMGDLGSGPIYTFEGFCPIGYYQI